MAKATVCKTVIRRFNSDHPLVFIFRHAGMMELVDIRDLKSLGYFYPCGFKSRSRHSCFGSDRKVEFMKKLLFLLSTFVVFTSTAFYPLTIQEIHFIGRDTSEKSTLLHFLYEGTNRNYSPEDLSNTLTRYEERLERTGWYKNVVIFSEISFDHATVTVNLEEKTPYSFWVGNFYLGLSRYNLWGKGKTVNFEIGPVRRKIIIEDQMFQMSDFFYSIDLGSEEYSYYSYPDTNYLEIDALRRLADFNIGKIIFPDIAFSLSSQNHWLDQTNGFRIGAYNKLGAILDFDRRAGYPFIYKGESFQISSFYIFPHHAVQIEGSLNGYWQILQGIVIAGRAHGGWISSEVPDYLRFSLRNIDGLRTLNPFPGMIGNTCYDLHGELRWAFWDLIPLFIFDMQLEALTFVDAGEARNNFSDFGRTHVVSGAGLRIYIENFTIRTELGVDETGGASLLTSFNAPF